MHPPLYESGYISLSPNTLNVYTIQYAIKKSPNIYCCWKATIALSESEIFQIILEEHVPDQDVSLLYMYALILHGNKYASSCTWSVYME